MDTIDNNKIKLSLEGFAREFADENDLIVESKISGYFTDWLREEQLPLNLHSYLLKIYIPFINLLLKRKKMFSGKTPVIGICGSQGSGKSTFTYLLSKVLENGYNIKASSFSLDDFYLPRKTREENGLTIHPLLKTRGVPGTHDVALGIKTIQDLKNAGDKSNTRIPCFDKSVDDQYPGENWNVYKGKPDIILFEGWCVGAIPEEATKLQKPLNDLEKQHDNNGSWRKYVNDQLAGDYRKWFSEIDFLVFLKVPSFAKVYEWRWLQEQKLKEKMKAGKLLNSGSRIMNEEEVRFFISHYERLTKHILAEMPSRAEVVIDIGDDHQFEKIEIGKGNIPI